MRMQKVQAGRTHGVESNRDAADGQRGLVLEQGGDDLYEFKLVGRV